MCFGLRAVQKRASAVKKEQAADGSHDDAMQLDIADAAASPAGEKGAATPRRPTEQTLPAAQQRLSGLLTSRVRVVSAVLLAESALLFNCMCGQRRSTFLR